MRAECVITSCSRTEDATLVMVLNRRGWKLVVPSGPEPDDRNGHKPTQRTHLGWCPTCAVKFGVEAIK